MNTSYSGNGRSGNSYVIGDDGKVYLQMGESFVAAHSPARAKWELESPVGKIPDYEGTPYYGEEINGTDIFLTTCSNVPTGAMASGIAQKGKWS